MPPVKAAHTTLVLTDTSASALVVGGANGASTTGTGGINGGKMALSAGIAIDGGTLTDHGIVMPSAVPAVTTMALYNNSGTLTWNGIVLATGASLSGTIGRIPKFTAANAVGDSIVAESGATLTVTGTLNVTTGYQLNGSDINAGGTLTNIPYLNLSNTFSSVGGQKFEGGISISGGTQSSAGIMIPDATPLNLATKLYNNGGALTWSGGGGVFDSGAVTVAATTDSGASISGSVVAVTRYDASLAPTYTANKGRGTIGAATVVVSGDTLFTLEAKGYDGAAFQSAASITALVDTTCGSNDMPGRLIFSTSADGTTSPVERVRVNSSGNVGIGTSATTIAARLHSVSTTEQLRIGYDGSNYLSTTVAANGATTLAVTGGGAFTFSQAVTGSAGFVGNLTGNVTGNVSGSAATVTTAAQTAITSTGTLTTLTNAGPLLLTGVITPTQLVANTDNWNPAGLATANVIRIDASTPINLTGIVAQASGTMIVLYNLSANAITLIHDATSTAANRFFCPNAIDLELSQKESCWLRYDGSDTRWTVIQ